MLRISWAVWFFTHGSIWAELQKIEAKIGTDRNELKGGAEEKEKVVWCYTVMSCYFTISSLSIIYSLKRVVYKIIIKTTY